MCFIPILFLIGNIGNLLSAWIFAKKSWRKNVCVFYFNICLLTNTLYVNSCVLSALLIIFKINLYDSNTVLCKIYFYVVYLFSTLTPTVIILASIDRLLISSQNVNTRLYSSRRLAYFSVSIFTVIWFIYYCHILIKVDIQQIYPNYFLCYYDILSNYFLFISFSSLIINCSICLIMFILCLFAFKNVRRIRSVPRQQRQQLRLMTKKDFVLLRCLYAQDIIYILFSIELSIFSVYQTAVLNHSRTAIEQAVDDFFYRFCILLHHFPYCISFLVFVIASKAFRNDLKRIIWKICEQTLAPIREEENSQSNLAVVLENQS